MVEDSSAVATPVARAAGGERIGRADLRTVEASGLSLAGLAPTMAMALGTAFAASEAGGAVPLSYLLAMIGSFSLAFVVVRFARRYDVASGVAYTYVRASFGKLAGFVTGWLYVAAWLSSTAVVLAIGGVSFSALLARNGVNAQLGMDLPGRTGDRRGAQLPWREAVRPPARPARTRLHGGPRGSDDPRHRRRRRRGTVMEALRSVAVAQGLERYRLRNDLRVLGFRRIRSRRGTRQGEPRPAPGHPARDHLLPARRRGLLHPRHLRAFHRLRRHPRGNLGGRSGAA